MSEAIVGGAYSVGERVGGSDRVSAHLAHDETGATYIISFVEPRDEEEQALLEQRAAVASEVQHRYVAQVVTWGMHEERFYVVREYVQGEDLASLLSRRQTLDWVSAVRYLTFVAAGLAEAEDKGIAHGSLRPERIVLTPDGTVKVTGLELPPDVVIGEVHDTTLPGDVLYLSPEQVSGQPATPLSDIYAQGVILYQLVTGVTPFDAATGVAVAAEHRTAEPERPRRVNPDVPPSVEAILMRCLAKDPADRPQTEAELARELDAIAVGSTDESALAAGRRPVWPWVLIALLLALAGAATYVVVTLFWAPVPDVTGQSLEFAQEELTAGGYAVGQVTHDADATATAEAGTVVRQSPEAGTRTRADATVDLVVAGAELATVPDVVRMDEIEAAAKLGQSGFGVKVEEAASATEKPGTVLAQRPAAGERVPKGTDIVINVSSGPKMAVVPNVVGRSQEEATTALVGAGFVVTPAQAYDATVKSGVVVSQSPPAGVSAEASTTVTIVVSRGPEPPAKVRVPNLTGLTESAARDELQAVGLKVKTLNTADAPNAGKVVAQTPAVGTMVEAGSTVTITVATL